MFKKMLNLTRTWGAVLLVAFGLVFPSTSLAHHKVEMEHDMHSSKDCMGDDCEPSSSSDLSCLEHCLQTTSKLSQDDLALNVGVSSTAILPVKVFLQAPQQIKFIPQKTGPPRSTKPHLTTQKRE